MEPQFTSNNQDPVIIKEENSSQNTWYMIIAVLIFALIGWYGYTAGWFNQRASTTIISDTPISAGVNPGGQLGFGLDMPSEPAPIDSIRIEVQESFPVQHALVVSGTLQNGCIYVNDPQQLRDGNVFYITLDTRTEGDICTEALVPYKKSITLQTTNLPAGVYIVNINGRELSFELENDNEIDFSAGEGK